MTVHKIIDDFSTQFNEFAHVLPTLKSKYLVSN